MKKIFAFILCVLLICATPLIAFAEEGETPTTETEVVEGENSTTTEETVTEGEILPPETIPEETPEVPEETPTEDGEPNWEEVKETISDKIVNWVLPHIEEIAVVITLFLNVIYNIRRNKALDKSVGTLNNNAITIAKNSADAMDKASGAVTGYQANIVALLEAFKTTAEDKQRLEAELVEIKNYLHTATKSNLEFADELAELLGLANIPNYKKEEIGSRHIAAKRAIIDAEEKAEAAALLPTSTEEVKKDVGEEA